MANGEKSMTGNKKQMSPFFFIYLFIISLTPQISDIQQASTPLCRFATLKNLLCGHRNTDVSLLTSGSVKSFFLMLSITVLTYPFHA